MEFLKEYIAMWQNYANFKDRTNLRGYWMPMLINFIVCIILGAIVSAVPLLSIVSILYALAIFVPGLAITVRRLKDMGKEWTMILLGLIPCVGFIILIVFLIKPSVPDDGTPVV
jgi:uncharacterized membrane protein YhaH (DUF805 family)